MRIVKITLLPVQCSLNVLATKANRWSQFQATVKATHKLLMHNHSRDTVMQL